MNISRNMTIGLNVVVGMVADSDVTVEMAVGLDTIMGMASDLDLL